MDDQTWAVLVSLAGLLLQVVVGMGLVVKVVAWFKKKLGTESTWTHVLVFVICIAFSLANLVAQEIASPLDFDFTDGGLRFIQLMGAVYIASQAKYQELIRDGRKP